MFLSTMTADAASQHGHEFSSPRTPTLSAVATFPRSTLNALIAVATRQMSPASKPPPAEEDAHDEPPPPSPSPPLPREDDNSSTNTQLHVRPPSSSSAESVVETKSKKRTPRAKTKYNLCHPPPSARKKPKLHLRPRVLLQLQQVSNSSRPKPAYEVSPSFRCAPKMLSKFSRVLRAIDRLGPDDIVVLRAAQYGRSGEVDSSDDESSDSREAIGAVCVESARDGKQGLVTDICMEDGSVWRATPMQNGGYEFVTIDEHGLQLKARWVARMTTSRRKSGTLEGRSGSDSVAEEKKFTFSTIRPDCRRHPIIASMTRTSIEVMDEYTMPATTEMNSPSSAQTPVVTPSAGSESESYMEARKVESTPIKTHDALHKLILVTGIWVALRENWSTAFRYNASPTNTCFTPIPENVSFRPAAQRAVSMPPMDKKLQTSSPNLEESRRTMPKLFRTGTSLLKRHSSSGGFPSPTSSSSSSPASVSASFPRSQRSNSMEIDYLKRASNNWHRQQLDSHRQENSVLESPQEMEYDFEDSVISRSGLSSPVKPNAATITVAQPSGLSHELNLVEERRKELADAPKRTGTQVQSAYIVPESTRGLWDSGDPAVPPSGRRGRKKERSKSDQDNHKSSSGSPDKNKRGRIRRMLSFFRRGTP